MVEESIIMIEVDTIRIETIITRKGIREVSVIEEVTEKVEEEIENTVMGSVVVVVVTEVTETKVNEAEIVRDIEEIEIKEKVVAIAGATERTAKERITSAVVAIEVVEAMVEGDIMVTVTKSLEVDIEETNNMIIIEEITEIQKVFLILFFY